jgi:hypothetical protein
MSDERQTRLPTGVHREPAGPDGTPGRVLIMDFIQIGGLLTDVRRHAVSRGREGEDAWRERSVSGNLANPSKSTKLGMIGSDQFAKLVGDQSLEVHIAAGDGPPRGVIMYGALSLTDMVFRLALYINVPPGRFAWLWNEMMSRPNGQLSVSLRHAALGYADAQPGEQPARYFADEGLFVGHLEQPDQQIELRVDDDWGGDLVT